MIRMRYRNSSQTYSADDLKSRLKTEKQAWLKEYEAKQKLSPEELEQSQTSEMKTKLAQLESELTRRDLEKEAAQSLSKDGFPAALLQFLNYSDKASLEKSLDMSNAIAKKLDVVDFKQGNINLRVTALNGVHPIIRAGSSRLKTEHTFFDGRTASDGAETNPTPN